MTKNMFVFQVQLISVLDSQSTSECHKLILFSAWPYYGGVSLRTQPPLREAARIRYYVKRGTRQQITWQLHL